MFKKTLLKCIILALTLCFTGVQTTLAQFKSAGSQSLSEEKAKEYANSAMKLYTNLCIHHMSNLDELRQILTHEPELPPKSAQYYLAGREGKSWAARGVDGNYVLSIANENDYCAVHVLRASPSELERQFDLITQSVPQGAEFTLLKDELQASYLGGQSHTKMYTLTNEHNAGILVLSLFTMKNPREGIPQGVLVITTDEQ